jgi:hypothetical protein
MNGTITITVYKLAVGFSQPPVTRTSGIKRPERAAAHSSPFIIELRMHGDLSSFLRTYSWSGA